MQEIVVKIYLTLATISLDLRFALFYFLTKLNIN